MRLDIHFNKTKNFKRNIENNHGSKSVTLVFVEWRSLTIMTSVPFSFSQISIALTNKNTSLKQFLWHETF